MKKSFRPTKIASKRRRDLLNAEISCIRNLLPLTEIQRQRLSQIQVMSLCNAYVAINGFMADFCLKDEGSNQAVNSTSLTQIFPGFILILSSSGQILYVSDNAADHLGYTSLELLTQGDTVYDFIEADDHSSLRMILETMSLPDAFSSCASQTVSLRMFVAQNFRSLYSYHHYRMMAVKGRVIRRPTKGSRPGTIPQAIFVALVAPQSRPFLDSIDFPSFHSVHGLDMKFIEIDHSGSIWMGYNVDEVKSKSWYEMLHPDDVYRAKEAHLNLLQCQRQQDGRPASLCIRIQTHYGHFIWIQVTMLLHRRSADKLEISCSNCVVTDERAREIVRCELNYVETVCDGSGFKERQTGLLADDTQMLGTGREGFLMGKQTESGCLRSAYPLLKAMLDRPTLRQLRSAAMMETRSFSATSPPVLPRGVPAIDALLTPQNSPPDGIHQEFSHKDNSLSPVEIYTSEGLHDNSGWEEKFVGQSGWDLDGMAYSYCETPPTDQGDRVAGGLCSMIAETSSAFEQDVETMPLDVIIDALKAMQNDPELYKEVEGLDLGVFSKSFPELEKTKKNPYGPGSLENPLPNVLLPYLSSTTTKLTHGQVETLNHRLFELKKAHERLVLEAVVETLHCGNAKTSGLRSELQDLGGLQKGAVNL